MALAVANSWQNSAVSTFVAVTVSGFNAGDLCVTLAYGFDTASGDTFIIQDDVTNTYSKPAETTQDGTTFRSWAALFYSVVTTPPTSVSVAATGFPSIEMNAVVLRITGNHSSPFDQANKRTQTADDPTNNSITTTQADEIIVCGLTHDGPDTTFDPPTGFTMAQEKETASGNPFAAAYQIVSSTGTYSPQWLTGASRDYAMVISSFKASAATTTSADVNERRRRRNVQVRT